MSDPMDYAIVHAGDEKRPDSVKCVIAFKPTDMRGDGLNKSWCGRTIETFEFHFLDVEHAIGNARSQGRLLTCGRCVDAIAALLRGHQWPETT